MEIVMKSTAGGAVGRAKIKLDNILENDSEIFDLKKLFCVKVSKCISAVSFPRLTYLNSKVLVIVLFPL